jgi:Rne/Rng family ribonuclease
MQSAFVDVGLERDAFLYVSDFMELEEHDEDVTDVVPTTRSVPDLRRAEAPAGEISGSEGGAEPFDSADSETEQAASPAEIQSAQGDAAPEVSGAAGSQDRDRGGSRGRRRRRGGRRDGRDRGEDRGPARDGDRNAEPQLAGPAVEAPPARTQEPPVREQETGRDSGRDANRQSGRPSGRDSNRDSSRGSNRDSGRSQQFGPPPGYQPMVLPGESISKYKGLSATPPAPVKTSFERPGADRPSREPASFERPAHEQNFNSSRAESVPAEHLPAPIAATFPEDEPYFAGASAAEPLHEQHDDARVEHEEPRESASTSVDWRQEYRQPESRPADPANSGSGAGLVTREETVEETEIVASEPRHDDQQVAAPERSDRFVSASQESRDAAFVAAAGTIEEETIDEEEADIVRYSHETGEDEGFDEFEEETQAAGDDPRGSTGREIAAAGESDSAGQEPVEATSSGSNGAEGAQEEGEEEEEDGQELELEEAQAEAEALLAAEAGGNGTSDARAEVRAPAGTAGYTQRAPRPGSDRQRGGGQRGRRGGSSGGRFRKRESAPVPLISDLLKEGQEILVQIAKEPIGKKGARITSHIALPGRFLVYMPTVNHGGVSRKIASEEERQRLKRIVMSERENGHGGFIVRTAAQSATEEELRADIRFLKGLWNEIKSRADSGKSPALIYHDLNVVERVLRDQVTSDFSVIWVDTEPEYERILRFFNRFQPSLVKRVKLYTKETPLFEQFGLAEEMNKALKSKVWLKSGGYIVINQTEALVAIDINTGKYVGKTARLEDTIVKTNVDAIKEIVRQIRLRDLGGIIIIDFIDMDERRNRQRVMQALEEELRHDRSPSKVLQFNDFGLVAITRKRVKQSLERTIGAPCPYCQSTGYVKSITTVCNEIYVEMRKIARHLEHDDVMLRVNPDVAKELKGTNGRLLNEMEELTKRTIIVKSDPALHQEQYDIN